MTFALFLGCNIPARLKQYELSSRAVLGKLGVDTMSRYKWYFISAGAIGMGFMAWIIYLKFLLAKKAIESQTEVDKYRMQLQLTHNDGIPLQLDYDPNQQPLKPMVAWDKDRDGPVEN